MNPMHTIHTNDQNLQPHQTIRVVPADADYRQEYRPYEPERRGTSLECQHRFNSIKIDLKEDISEMKEAIKALAAGMNKLTLIEERQQNTANAQAMMLDTVQKLSSRIAMLEQEQVNSKRISAWVDRAVIGCIGILVLFVFSKTGLM